MSCDTSYYRTPYNIQMQKLYCNMAQKADTDLSRVITSGWSYDRSKASVENYCGCGYGMGYVAGCNCGNKLNCPYYNAAMAQLRSVPLVENYHSVNTARLCGTDRCVKDVKMTEFDKQYNKLYGNEFYKRGSVASGLMIQNKRLNSGCCSK